MHRVVLIKLQEQMLLQRLQSSQVEELPLMLQSFLVEELPRLMLQHSLGKEQVPLQPLSLPHQTTLVQDNTNKLALTSKEDLFIRIDIQR
jgi:hypothetical protein